MDTKIAQRSDDVTDEMWAEVNEFNRDMVKEYLENQAELSVKSKIGYESALKIFFYWVKDNLKNKSCLDIKKKEFVRYLNWLTIVVCQIRLLNSKNLQLATYVIIS